MKNEIKLEIIKLVEENIEIYPELKCEAVCLHIAQIVEKTILPAYSKIVDAYWDAFPTGDYAIILDHNVPIGNAVYDIDDTYNLKAQHRMSSVAETIDNYSETLAAVIAEEKNVNDEHPSIPYLNQALELQNRTSQFIKDAEAVMLDAVNLK